MSISTDWLLLGLRLLFVGLLYLFLFRIVKLTRSEISLLAKKESRISAKRPALIMIDPAESSVQIDTKFPLGQVAIVGRSSSSTIPIDDAFVSSQHARIEIDGDEWRIHDLNSTNGTFVNGEQIRGIGDITEGDVVQFGRVTMRLVQ
jgi:pSer/pThr/pTyr-binding forkhead associated (FHA) protein